MRERINIFGVRHLSPGAAYHLVDYLNGKQPKCVLIEGPSDANAFIGVLTEKGVKPPVAILACTVESPIEKILYPFARYSPEYQAILWGVRKGCTVRFIDLPSDILLKLQILKNRGLVGKKGNNGDKGIDAEERDWYARLAREYGEDDFESYWERYFEHNLNKDTFRENLTIQSAQIRELDRSRDLHGTSYEYAYNEVREAFMRREIDRALAEGFNADEIVAVVGAYHVTGIANDRAPMSSDELKSLPRVNSKLALMPYSYYRLSSRTGYGAGNLAPQYFDYLWLTMTQDKLYGLSAMYLSMVAVEQRKRGHSASSANVIDAVRLAESLALLKGGSMPTLRDLHDAAVTCFGGGELSMVAETLNRIDVGVAIGALPQGVGQTPMQDDVNRQLKALLLEKYKSAVVQTLELDLRENTRVKSSAAAFRDLNRSIFLHRLSVSGIHFATQQSVRQELASWREIWKLQWSPEIEIEIVEANIIGETVELAAVYQLSRQLDEKGSILDVASVVRTSCECALVNIFDTAVAGLQNALVEVEDFKETVYAAKEVATLLQYGSLRRLDLEPLRPILGQIFLHATLLLLSDANCDNKAAVKMKEAINTMEIIAEEMHDDVDSALWHSELHKLAFRDDLNPILSGVAFSIMLEHGLVSDDDCDSEVSLRLSPGIPAERGAGWFEGLAERNKYALLSQIALWQTLDVYIRSLDDDEFMRAVVFLRRAFGHFDAYHKNSVAELLGEIWGVGVEKTAEYLQSTLTDEEKSQLAQLNEFEF
jgi:hypothetical protein